MSKAWFLTASLAVISSLAYAGSCDDCYETYQEHYTACDGDTICQQRVQEQLDRCLIGCN